MSDIKKPDPWSHLRQFTPARIALGRAGHALPTEAVLDFAVAHAEARDAVWQEPDWERVRAGLEGPLVEVNSRAPDRRAYLLRPDLGRSLRPEDRQRLRAQRGDYDLALVGADGLSGLALERHLGPMLGALGEWLGPAGWRLAPLVLARQARVALGDEVAEALGARAVLVLIGERPGLSAADSLGAYLTHAPGPHHPDSGRNCVSNIRPGGLGYLEASHTLRMLIHGARALGESGVRLKPEARHLPG